MRNAAVYFPRVRRPDPLRGGATNTFAPCGAVAGIFARTDAQRGVWKAPAGIDAGAGRASSASPVPLDRRRERAAQPARHQLPAHLPGRRHASSGARARCAAPTCWPTSASTCRCGGSPLFLEESLYRGTQWVVFEPNDEPLWAQIRLNVGAFMHDLFRQGAFQGTTPREAYFVKCDAETTTQNDIDLGHRQHRRRLRAAQAGRVRRHPDPADRRPDRRPEAGDEPMAQFTVNAHALRSVQELQVPGEVGRPLRRRRQQGRRAQAHDRGRQAPRGRRPEQQPQVARAHRVRGDHARARRHPRHRVRAVGEQGLELRRRASAPRSR